MPEFRAYFLDQSGRISQAALIITANSDEEAIEATKAFADGQDVELWQGERIVASIKAQTKSP